MTLTLETLKMGNYGAYVWSSYALALIALVVMASLARTASNRELKSARRRNQISHQHAQGDKS